MSNNNYATKTDLKNLATKKDLQKFATKTELKQLGRSLRGDILRVEERVENLEDGQKEIRSQMQNMDGKLDKLQNTLDGFVGKVDKLETENEIGTHQIRQLDVRVSKLEGAN